MTDQKGSITGRTNSSGTSLSVNRYTQYGEPDAANTGRFQYTGQVWLDEIGLYYYKARFYDPTIKRFLNTDQIGYAGGMNMYAYVGGDPVNYNDPSGLLARPGACPDGTAAGVGCGTTGCPPGWTCYAPGSITYGGRNINGGTGPFMVGDSRGGNGGDGSDGGDPTDREEKKPCAKVWKPVPKISGGGLKGGLWGFTAKGKIKITAKNTTHQVSGFRGTVINGVTGFGVSRDIGQAQFPLVTSTIILSSRISSTSGSTEWTIEIHPHDTHMPIPAVTVDKETC